MIHYLEGDATQPQGDGFKIIAHVCNNVGAWGAGFVLALSKRWKAPEVAYRYWASQLHGQRMPLGEIQTVLAEADIAVVNMIAQRGIGRTAEGIPLQYLALDICLEKLAKHAKQLGASIHMPRIGCGLAGGDWADVERLINSRLGEVEVYVYDLPKDK